MFMLMGEFGCIDFGDGFSRPVTLMLVKDVRYEMYWRQPLTVGDSFSRFPLPK